MNTPKDIVLNNRDVLNAHYIMHCTKLANKKTNCVYFKNEAEKRKNRNNQTEMRLTKT